MAQKSMRPPSPSGEASAVCAPRGRIYRRVPAGISDPLRIACWQLACFLGRRGERIRLDLRAPGAVRGVSDADWAIYWSGYDRAELRYRTRRNLACDGPLTPQIMLGTTSGAMAACRRAARRLVRGRPLNAQDLLCLLTLLHEMHHGVSAGGVGGHDYGLAYEHAWAVEEGFAHAMSTWRLPEFLREVGATVEVGALEEVLHWCERHELAEHAIAVTAASRRFGGLEEGWRAFTQAGLIERMCFCSPVADCPTIVPLTREIPQAVAA